MAELVTEAAELETAHAAVDGDVADADEAECVREAAAALQCPPAVAGGLGGGGCVAAAVVDAAEDVIWLTQLSSY